MALYTMGFYAKNGSVPDMAVSVPDTIQTFLLTHKKARAHNPGFFFYSTLENRLNQITTSPRIALHRLSPGGLNAGKPSSRIHARTTGLDALANSHISANPQRMSLT